MAASSTSTWVTPSWHYLARRWPIPTMPIAPWKRRSKCVKPWIGDGVNLASRLEGLTKTPEYATRIIISRRTLAKAKGQYQTRSLGEVAVKGKQKPTEIYALLGRVATPT